MTKAEREELIVKMAKAAYESAGAMRWCNERDEDIRGWWLREARAALAVAEPVIREQCAKIAEKTPYAFDAGKDMNTIAAAIREGKDD